MNPLKCAFGITSGKFLGFVVINEGIQVDLSKVEAITTMAPPENTKELQAFIGRISYIQCFVPGLAQLMTAFFHLLKKHVTFAWGEVQCTAFEKLKQYLINPKFLRPPTRGVPIYLHTEFTSLAIGAVLARDIEGNELSPIYYVSRVLRDAELRRTARWLLQLSEFELKYQRPNGVRGQAIADLIAMFPGEGDDEVHEYIPGEVAAADIDKPWTMFFDELSYATVGGAIVVFEAPRGDLLSYSFKLDFPCSNNIVEYEALILGLKLEKELNLWSIKVKGDSKLVTNQVSGDFHVKEPHLAPYRAEAQSPMNQTGSTLDHTGRSENRHADALETLERKMQLNGEEDGTVTVRRK
ncbi:uncharacterized protein LOC113290648 [Papaver somniferum]|uniref:uncharacterized protein LOC113290648 n=1 Tax=Papaver somniferum TaxID=3469 RepID=UPI000E702565|nr:uncharacterized protein LOC113290648 [Papaver somniferum]